MSGSGHQCLGINGSKSKVVAEFETSSIGGQVVHSQYVNVRGVDYQILDISPRQIRTVFTFEGFIAGVAILYKRRIHLLCLESKSNHTRKERGRGTRSRE